MLTETTTPVSPTRYFWLQLTALASGLGALFLAHHVTRRLDDSTASTTFATVVVIVLVAASLAVIGRAVYVIVTSAFSDAYRVFRTRHLLFCGTLLFAVAASEAGWLIWRGPFDKFFAHGRITGEVIVEVSTVLAALVCMVGAGVALTGAWERRHVERNWHRTLHLYSRRRI
jgi:uncharacterized membrane protein YidH (DUF202 family)